MPRKSRNNAPRRDNRRRAGGQVANVLRTIAASVHSGEPADRVINAADYTYRPQSWVFTQTPPKSIRNQIHWFQKTVTLVNGQSISTSVPVEYNYAFTIATLTPEYTALLSVFDQYAIHSVFIHLNVSNFSTNSGTAGRVTTALDYDNVANLGSEGALQEFASAQTCEVAPGINIERVLMPTVDPQLYQTAGTGYGAARMWVDSASSSVPHYGYRSYWANNTVSSLSFDLVVTSVFGFRNSI
jgi:hypothetical protein